jgi:hypothetical protein
MAPRPRAQTASSRAVPRTIDLEAGINRALLTVGGERKGRCERRRAEVDEADQQFERAAGRSRYWLAPWRSGPGGTDGCGRPGQQRAREGGAHVTSPKRKLAQDRHRDRSDRPPPGRSPSVERSHGGGRPLLLPDACTGHAGMVAASVEHGWFARTCRLRKAFAAEGSRQATSVGRACSDEDQQPSPGFRRWHHREPRRGDHCVRIAPSTARNMRTF